MKRLGVGSRRRTALVGAVLGVSAGLLAGCSEAERPVESGVTQTGLYYEIAGSGTPVILLHGFSMDGRMWDDQVDALARHFRVVRYDLRGHGRSAAITAPYTAHGDLLSVFEALQIERAALVGHSMGAQVAVDFTLSHPERVTALVLAGPGLSGYVASEPRDWMNPMIEAMRAGDTERVVTLWMETPLMGIPQNVSGDSTMRRIVRDNAGIWSANPTFQVPLDPPAIGRLGTVRVPTLVLVGDADLRVTHRVADTIAVCIIGARRQTVPNAGHVVNLAAPEAFNRAVRDFLLELPAAPAVAARSPCS